MSPSPLPELRRLNNFHDVWLLLVILIACATFIMFSQIVCTTVIKRGESSDKAAASVEIAKTVTRK